MPDFWRTEKGLDEIEEIDLEILKRDIFAESVGTSFHSPMTTIFRGRKIPTIAVKHRQVTLQPLFISLHIYLQW